MSSHINGSSSNDDRQREFELAQIRESLKGLRFGTVNIVVQDGVVVQIDRTEKKRLVRRGDVDTSKR